MELCSVAINILIVSNSAPAEFTGSTAALEANLGWMRNWQRLTRRARGQPSSRAMIAGLRAILHHPKMVFSTIKNAKLTMSAL